MIVKSALTIYNTRIEELKIFWYSKKRTQNILYPTFNGNNPASYEQKINSKLSKTLNTVSGSSLQYHGNPKNWPVHKKQLF